MRFRVSLCLGAAVTAVVLSVTSIGASAATVSLSADRFSRSQLDTAQAARSEYLKGATVRGVETFEDMAAWDGKSGTANPQHTKVGSFSSFGTAGSGGSVVGDGSKLQVRGDDSMPWGRYSTSEQSLGGHWLDSNDNLGLSWEISGVGLFDTVSFFVLDAADVGGKFSVKAGDKVFSNLAGARGKLANGNIQFVKILLSEAVDHLTVELMHDRSNDGFGVDGATVSLAAIPLPPAALLLGTGLVGLVGLRRRRRTA